MADLDVLTWRHPDNSYVYKINRTPTGRLTLSKYLYNEATRRYDVKDKEHSRTVDAIKGVNWWTDYVKKGLDIPTEDETYRFFGEGKEKTSVSAKDFGWSKYKTELGSQTARQTLMGLEKMPYAPAISKARKTARMKTEIVKTGLPYTEVNLRSIRQKYPDSAIFIDEEGFIKIEEPVTSDITVPASEILEPSISLPWKEGTETRLKESILENYKQRIIESESEKLKRMSSLEKESLGIEDEAKYLRGKVEEKLSSLEGRVSEEELPSLIAEKKKAISQAWIPYEDLSPRDKRLRQQHIHDIEEAFRKMSPVELHEDYAEAVELEKITPSEAWDAMRYKLNMDEGVTYGDEEWDFIKTIGLVGYPEEYLPRKEQKWDKDFDWATYYEKYGKVFDAVSGGDYYSRQAKEYKQRTQAIEKAAAGPWSKEWDEEYLKLKEEYDKSQETWEDIYSKDLKEKFTREGEKKVLEEKDEFSEASKIERSPSGYWREIDPNSPLKPDPNLKVKMDLSTGKVYVWTEGESVPFEEVKIKKDVPFDEESTLSKMEAKTLGYYDPRVTGYQERLTELSESFPETKELDVIETGRQEWIPYGRGGGMIAEYIEEPVILEKGESSIEEDIPEETFYYDPERGIRQAYWEKYAGRTPSTPGPKPKIIVPGGEDLRVWEGEDYKGLNEF